MKHLIATALLSLMSVSAFAGPSFSGSLSGTATSSKMVGATAELSVANGVLILKTCPAQEECSVLEVKEPALVGSGFDMLSGDIVDRYSLSQDILLVSEGRGSVYKYSLFYGYSEETRKYKGYIKLSPQVKLNL